LLDVDLGLLSQGSAVEHIAVELKNRTKSFALRIIKLVRALPASSEGKVIGVQLLRCGTSVGANYRAVCRARSRAEFLAKLGLVIEEADESAFWLEILGESGLLPEKRLVELKSEANELVAILNASRTTARRILQSRINNPHSSIQKNGGI
jgi:four helix bundle protein